MIGLEYLCKMRSKSFTDVAKELGVSKQTVNSWIKGRRRIPEKHFPILSKMFDDINAEYLQKEISEVDKSNARRLLGIDSEYSINDSEKMAELIEWLKGEKYILANNSKDKTDQDYKWEVSRNRMIDKTINKISELMNI